MPGGGKKSVFERLEVKQSGESSSWVDYANTPCTFLAQQGWCKYKDSCIFKHSDDLRNTMRPSLKKPVHKHDKSFHSKKKHRDIEPKQLKSAVTPIPLHSEQEVLDFSEEISLELKRQQLQKALEELDASQSTDKIEEQIRGPSPINDQEEESSSGNEENDDDDDDEKDSDNDRAGRAHHRHRHKSKHGKHKKSKKKKNKKKKSHHRRADSSSSSNSSRSREVTPPQTLAQILPSKPAPRGISNKPSGIGSTKDSKKPTDTVPTRPVARNQQQTINIKTTKTAPETKKLEEKKKVVSMKWNKTVRGQSSSLSHISKEFGREVSSSSESLSSDGGDEAKGEEYISIHAEPMEEEMDNVSSDDSVSEPEIESRKVTATGSSTKRDDRKATLPTPRPTKYSQERRDKQNDAKLVKKVDTQVGKKVVDDFKSEKKDVKRSKSDIAVPLSNTEKKPQGNEKERSQKHLQLRKSIESESRKSQPQPIYKTGLEVKKYSKDDEKHSPANERKSRDKVEKTDHLKKEEIMTEKGGDKLSERVKVVRAKRDSSATTVHKKDLDKVDKPSNSKTGEQLGQSKTKDNIQGQKDDKRSVKLKSLIATKPAASTGNVEGIKKVDNTGDKTKHASPPRTYNNHRHRGDRRGPSRSSEGWSPRQGRGDGKMSGSNERHGGGDVQSKLLNLSGTLNCGGGGERWLEKGRPMRRNRSGDGGGGNKGKGINRQQGIRESSRGRYMVNSKPELNRNVRRGEVRRDDHRPSQGDMGRGRTGGYNQPPRSRSGENKMNDKGQKLVRGESGRDGSRLMPSSNQKRIMDVRRSGGGFPMNNKGGGREVKRNEKDTDLRRESGGVDAGRGGRENMQSSGKDSRKPIMTGKHAPSRDDWHARHSKNRSEDRNPMSANGTDINKTPKKPITPINGNRAKPCLKEEGRDKTQSQNNLENKNVDVKEENKSELIEKVENTSNINEDVRDGTKADTDVNSEPKVEVKQEVVADASEPKSGDEIIVKTEVATKVEETTPTKSPATPPIEESPSNNDNEEDLNLMEYESITDDENSSLGSLDEQDKNESALEKMMKIDWHRARKRTLPRELTEAEQMERKREEKRRRCHPVNLLWRTGVNMRALDMGGVERVEKYLEDNRNDIISNISASGFLSPYSWIHSNEVVSRENRATALVCDDDQVEMAASALSARDCIQARRHLLNTSIFKSRTIKMHGKKRRPNVSLTYDKLIEREDMKGFGGLIPKVLSSCCKGPILDPLPELHDIKTNMETVVK